MPFPQCVLTATADSLSGQLDGDALTGSALSGMRVTFRANVPDTELVSYDGSLHAILEVESFFDSEGVLRPALAPEEVGVTLAAEDDSWPFQSKLQYLITFDPIIIRGKERHFSSWIIDAPEDGVTRNLAEIPRVIGAEFGGSIRVSVHLDEDGKVVFYTEGVPISDGLDLTVTELGSIDGGTPWSTGDGEIDGGAP